MNPLLETIGGLGLFLYGMAAMTSGLRKLAGDKLRLWLSRSTQTPISGVVTGTVTTAIVQSSSATIVAVVGFVGAGLLTFTQALGVIFGANIGTTITGWMVALVGFKLKLSAIALPLLFVAAVLYLFKSQPLMRGSGKALAGFCLIFLGIGYLQDGLLGYQDHIDLSQWRIDHFGGRLVLVAAGGILTLITQSSSATVATALTALNTSVLSLPQAAAVIIGADIGTTVTAALATIGGTTASKRTGIAHVIYNVITGIVAFLVLPGYLWAVDLLMPRMALDSGEVVAVSFHSFFNVMGVLLALPFTRQFARFITWLIAEDNETLTAAFDEHLLEDRCTALDALLSGVCMLGSATATLAADTLAASRKHEQRYSMESISVAIGVAREFALRIGSRGGGESVDANQLYATLHELDHLERLLERTSDSERASHAIRQPAFTDLSQRSKTLLDDLAQELSTTVNAATVNSLRSLATELDEDKVGFRKSLVEQAIDGEMDANRMDQCLDTHRWLRRMVYHAWRIAYYHESSHARSPC